MMQDKRHISNNAQRAMSNEQGFALVISMLVIVVLTLIGISSIQTTTIDMKISSNYRGSSQSLYAAEAGLEKVLESFLQGSDLDNNSTSDFVQVFQNGTDIGSSSSRVEVNSGDMRAYIWVDASNIPVSATISSRGNPSGTSSQKELAYSISVSASQIISGAINNAP